MFRINNSINIIIKTSKEFRVDNERLPLLRENVAYRIVMSGY